MIDSHSHIYGEEFDADRPQVIARAQAAGVRHIVLPNEGLKSLPRVVRTWQQYPAYVSPTIGLHPEEVGADWQAQLDLLEQHLHDAPFVAVGEVGIDLYWDATFRREQMAALTRQLRWCQRLGVPFIIHCRKGLDECLEVLSGLGAPLPQGVFHCFDGTVGDVERVRQVGDFYFGVNGLVTFKKSRVKELLPVIGLDRLLLETDSPYLAPVPLRGTRNESANVALVRDFVARELGVEPELVSQATDRNACRLFHLTLAEVAQSS